MNGKTQRGKQLQSNPHGGCTRRSALAWILCVALVLGGIWVPETGRSVQAEELAKVSDEMFAENSIEEYTSSEDDFSLEENYASWDAADVSVMSLNSAEDDIASGTYENITWRIDAEGTLTVEGTGEFSDLEGFSRAPWNNQRKSIKSAVVRVTGMKNASSMFFYCYNLTSVDMTGFDTSSVTDMSSMFYECWNLTSLDVGGFDTSSVTDMSGMFDVCRSLTSLDVSGFDTSSVTDMSGMFSYCSGLTSLDVSGFDTSSVTDMSSMFSGCSGLTSLDVSGFDTSSVTDMRYMFGGCRGLTSLDVSGFDTSRVTDMDCMFEYCDSIVQIKTFPNLQVQNIKLPVRMHDNNGNVYNLCPVGLAGSIVLYVEEAPHNITWTIDANGKLTVEGTGEFSILLDERRAPWYSERMAVKSAEIRISGLSDASYMFYDCRNLTSVDVSGFDSSSVTNMSCMFAECWSLTSLDASGFDTSSVTDMGGMFYECRNLTSVDMSGFDLSSVTDMSNMFGGCNSVTQIKTFLNLQMQKVELPVGMQDDEGNVYTYFPVGLSESITLYVWWDDKDIAHDTYKDIVWRIDTDGKLIVEGKGEFSDWAGEDGRAPWYGEEESVKSAEIRVSGLRDASYMFSGCYNLTSVDMTGFDTSSVTDMESMFNGCCRLTSLDLSGFDTGNVTDMSDMFAGCSGLTSLDLSGFDTSSVTDMRYMFYRCNGLMSLDVSGFNTSSVTHMGGMFSDCSGLTSLDVSGFNTSSVTHMGGMFYDCSSLTSLDVSGFDTSSVTHMGGMFSCCSGLTSLDVGGFDTSSVTDMGGMFSDCSSLTSLDVSGFDTSSVTYMSDMFSGCSGLTSLDLSGFDTSSVTSMGGMFSDCSGLTSLDVSGFDTSSVTYMSKMFSDCSGLTSLDVSGFDTSSVTYTFDMFSGCSGLTTLYTPYNVPTSMSCSLPTAEQTDVWYGSDGTTYKKLSTGLDHSIILMKNTKPDAAMPSRLTVLLAKSSYEPGSVVKPEDLTVKYRGTDGKTITLSYKSDTASGYTMSAVDMSTPGVKTLTVSYNDGTNTLTKSVTFTVSALLTDAMVTLLEGEYVYNGKAHRPVPLVKSADGETLTIGKDYAVSYTDNMDAGEAELSVTGRKAYSGTVTKSFTIQKAALENVEVAFAEPCGESQENRTQNLFDYFAESVKDYGDIAYTIGEIVEHNTVANGEGSVLSGTPSIDESGVLTYATNAGTAGDTVLIPVTVTFKKNYKDVLLNITICLTDKLPVAISGITMKNSTYNGSPVSPEGIAAVRTEGEAGEEVTTQVTLYYYYTGTQADGTAYDSGTAPTHAGSYILRVTVAENDFYEGSVEYPFEIGKASLTVTATDRKLVIGTFDSLPEESTLTCDITGLCGAHTAQDVLSVMPVVSYGLNGEKIDKASISIDKAGNYDLLPSGAVLNQTLGADYEITEQSYQKGTLTIAESGTENPENPDDPTKPDEPKEPEFSDDGIFHVSAVPAQTYTGSAIKPAVTVYYGSRRLTEKTDYTITYKNNIKANDAKAEKTAPTITIIGKGDYSGRQTITFVIQPKSIAGEDVTAAELIAAQSSKAKKPVPALTYQGKKLKNKTDFTVSYPDENKTGAYQTAGTYAVTVTGTGNYTGTKNLTYTITNKTLLAKAKVTVKPKDYTGSAVTLNAEDITVKVSKTTLAYGTDYTLSYRNNMQAGKATVIVTGTGENYAGSKEAAFQIRGESIAKAQITGIVDKTYTGTAQTQNIQVQLNGKTLKIGDDYTVSYAKEVNVGTAIITVTGKGGYTGSVKKSFKITAFDLQTNEGGKLQGVPKNLTVAYTKGGTTPALMLTFDGKPLVAKKDYTVIYQNNKKPASASDANAPAMVIKGKGNFKGTLTIPFAITVSNLETDGNVSIMAPDTAYVDKAGKYMTKPVLTDVNGKKLAAGTDYDKTFTYALVGTDGTEKALTAADTVPVGSEVTVTVTGKGNYTGTLSTTYRITKDSFARAKIAVTPQAYTGGAITLSTEDIKVELNGSTLIYGKDYTIVEGSYQNNTKRGTATVTIKGLGDYGGTKTVKFKITAKLFASFLKF